MKRFIILLLIVFVFASTALAQVPQDCPDVTPPDCIPQCICGMLETYLPYLEN